MSTPVQVLADIALALTAALSATDRYRHLLRAWHRAVPYDAAALLRLEDGALRPLAAEGLKAEALAHSYRLDDHPRLEIACAARAPVRFAADSALPDPFDGLLSNDADALGHVHACLACPLWVDDVLVGVLTADALAPDAFADVDEAFLAAVATLAAAALRTTHLIETLEHSAAQQALIARDLMRDLELRQGTQLIGISAVMERLRAEIEMVARSDFTVLITGESGVGKELVARALHAASARRDAPLIYVNCAALPETLAESELFGHERGAFTGAVNGRAGKFEVANGGTLLLDEIGELPLTIQPKLLRALQEGEIQRVGSDALRRVDVRVLAATNRDLAVEVQEGRFRADLYHRLNVYPLHVAPLRERREDIALLAGFFCDLTRRRLGVGPVRLAPAAISALIAYDWSGNVRELENMLSRVTLRAAATVPRGATVLIDGAQLGGYLGPGLPVPVAAVAPPVADTLSLRDATLAFQRDRIQRALDAHDGNWAAAARSLGMHRSNLHHLAGRLGLR